MTKIHVTTTIQRRRLALRNTIGALVATIVCGTMIGYLHYVGGWWPALMIPLCVSIGIWYTNYRTFQKLNSRKKRN